MIKFEKWRWDQASDTKRSSMQRLSEILEQREFVYNSFKMSSSVFVPRLTSAVGFTMPLCIHNKHKLNYLKDKFKCTEANIKGTGD
jgi:hypothetical protein